MRILTSEEVDKQYKEEPNPERWTVVIPAAGRGSRLGYDKPKLLYPIAGRMILGWLIDLLKPCCGKFIFVLSPSGVSHVVPHLDRLCPGRYEIVIQDEPRGMADAIFQAVPMIGKPHTLIIWGDQVAIRPQTIRNVMKIQQFTSGSKLTFPVVRRKNPYVHYVTDADGRFVDVLESREGASLPAIGESDCGVFAFDSQRLQQIFQQETARGIKLSQATKEWNFLPMLPLFETDNGNVNALRLDSLEETIGVNDANDAVILEQHLRKLSA